MQFSRLATLMAVLSFAAAYKHKVFHNLVEIDKDGDLPTGSAYDFTACGSKCKMKMNGCRGSTTRHIGDTIGQFIEIPGTSCLILHPNPGNKLYTCWNYGGQWFTGHGHDCGLVETNSEKTQCGWSGEDDGKPESKQTRYCMLSQRMNVNMHNTTVYALDAQ